MTTAHSPTAPSYIPTEADTDLEFLLSGKGSLQERRAALAACRARDKFAIGEWIKKCKELSASEARLRAENEARRLAIETAVKDLRWLASGSSASRGPAKTPSEIANELSAALSPKESP